MILFPSYINAIGPFLKVAVFFKEDSPESAIRKPS